ncbi:MAG: Tol-Pal system beta propeller repeat protein TolB [Gammaproteobacteria bacterium]|nr:Tol-Pal system beta propeller repeat protein TolB [Gammaproteobacteria bacterium]
MKLMLKTLLGFIFFSFSFQLYAAISIEITEGVEGAIPMSVVKFESASLPVRMKADIASIITNDLNRSGGFKVLNNENYPATPHYSKDVDYLKWRAIGQEYLVVGRILSKTAGVLDVQFQLLDVLKQKQLLGYSFPVRLRNVRSTAHEISDLIYQKITGIRGAFNTRIAYISARNNKSRKYVLQVADTDGFNPQTVLESDEPLMSPSWSPDGQSLAYVSFENKRPEIFIQHLATARRSKITGFKGINGAPNWSPDGKRLALVLSRDKSADIYTMNIATKKLTRLTRHRSIDTEPVWSAGGASLIFTSDRSGSPQLYEVPVNGGKPKRITFEGRYNTAADLSPDGKNIVMVYGDRGSYKIAQLERESGNLTLLTSNNLDESPSFSPNGRMVLYASTQGNKGVLYMVSLDGQSRHKLSDQAGDIREPVWGPYKKNRQ